MAMYMQDCVFRKIGNVYLWLMQLFAIVVIRAKWTKRTFSPQSEEDDDFGCPKRGNKALEDRQWQGSDDIATIRPLS